MSFPSYICLCMFIGVAVAQNRTSLTPGGGLSPTSRNDPSLYAVIRKIGDKQQICSAGIISHKHVLTTARCVNPKLTKPTEIIVATGYTRKASVSETLHDVVNVAIHRKYTGKKDPETGKMNDIAVIKVGNPILLGIYQTLISLPMDDVANTNPEIADRTGSSNTCSDQFYAYLKRPKSVGPVYSGNPLFHNGKLVGLLSASRPYTTTEPVLHTNIFSHLDFIDSCTSS